MGCQGSRRLSFHETFCLGTASKLLGIPHKSSLEWVWQRGEKPGSLRHPDQVPYIVTWKNLMEDTPLMDKSLSFPRPTSQVLAVRKKKTWEEITGPEKLILQDPSTADLLLQDPPLPYPPILAHMTLTVTAPAPGTLAHMGQVPLHPPLPEGRIRGDPPTSWSCHGDLKCESHLP